MTERFNNKVLMRMVTFLFCRVIFILKNNRACLDLGKVYTDNEKESRIPQFEIESIASCFLQAMQKYFASDKGKREFEEWEEIEKTTAEY